MITHGRSAEGTGVSILALAFLAISIPIETAYSWRGMLTDPYYAVKVAGWCLLIVGVVTRRGVRQTMSLVFFAAGWAWFAANFARAVADRFERVAAGSALRLGSVELWFAGACLAVSLAGLVWCLVIVRRRET